MLESQPAPSRRFLSIEFGASGSEYFRIWIVNLLLTVLTLGFYLPFAKARRLRYFYANTVIDGQPLAFHGDAWKMFRGYVLMLLLFGAYAALGQWSPWASFGGFVVLALLWPALWRSSLMFRLGNTSWRGLRFGFQGDLAGAYRAMLPWFVPGLVVLGMAALWFQQPASANELPIQPAMQKVYLGATVLLPLLLFPLGLGLSKRYQHQGYRYAGQTAQMDLSLGAFYKLGLKSLGLGLLAVALLGVGFAIVVPALVGAGKKGGLMISLILIGVFVGYLLLLSAIAPYFMARLQNLTWSATRSQDLAFDSNLGAWALCKLTFVNWLLTLLTLGLFRPFAVVRNHRLRLQAMAVVLTDDLASWRGQSGSQTAAAGEMSGDFFGIDMGL